LSTAEIAAEGEVRILLIGNVGRRGHRGDADGQPVSGAGRCGKAEDESGYRGRSAKGCM